jgi:hypothetical protein
MIARSDRVIPLSCETFGGRSACLLPHIRFDSSEDRMGRKRRAAGFLHFRRLCCCRSVPPVSFSGSRKTAENGNYKER